MDLEEDVLAARLGFDMHDPHGGRRELTLRLPSDLYIVKVILAFTYWL